MSQNGMDRPCSCPASLPGAPRQGALGLNDRGAIVLRQKWSRGQVEARLGQDSP